VLAPSEREGHLSLVVCRQGSAYCVEAVIKVETKLHENIVYKKKPSNIRIPPQLIAGISNIH